MMSTNTKLEKLFLFTISGDPVMLRLFKKLWLTVPKTNKDIIYCAMDLFNTLVQRDQEVRMSLLEQHGYVSWDLWNKHRRCPDYYFSEYNHPFYKLLPTWQSYIGTGFKGEAFIKLTNHSKQDKEIIKSWLKTLSLTDVTSVIDHVIDYTKQFPDYNKGRKWSANSPLAFIKLDKNSIELNELDKLSTFYDDPHNLLSDDKDYYLVMTPYLEIMLKKRRSFLRDHDKLDNGFTKYVKKEIKPKKNKRIYNRKNNDDYNRAVNEYTTSLEDQQKASRDVSSESDGEDS